MLEQIVTKKKLEVAEAKRLQPQAQLVKKLTKADFAFSKALATDWGLIAECKLASPAKGRLCVSHSVVELAQIYAVNGAVALSVHTDQHFYGKLSDIYIVKRAFSLPILRKDFIIDEYQLYEARHAGADAVLLIVAILSPNQLQEYIEIASELGMNCLVEVHSLAELKIAQQTDARIIGINNRNLATFTTDIQKSFDLSPYFDSNRLYVSESGIKSGVDAERLKGIGIRGILVGEGLVTAADIAAKTRELALIGNYGGKRYA